MLISEVSIWREVEKLSFYIVALTYFTGLHRNVLPFNVFDIRFSAIFPSLIKMTLHRYHNDLVKIP